MKSHNLLSSEFSCTDFSGVVWTSAALSAWKWLDTLGKRMSVRRGKGICSPRCFAFRCVLHGYNEMHQNKKLVHTCFYSGGTYFACQSMGPMGGSGEKRSSTT